MTDVIERRARAIATSQELDWSCLPELPSWGYSHHREKFRDMARATLEADRDAGLKLVGREPEQWVMQRASRGDSIICNKDVARLYWQTIFDAAPAWPGRGEEK